MKAPVAVLLELATLMAANVEAQPQIVHVSCGRGTGQGYAVSRPGECLVLTPKHVLVSNADVTVTGETARRVPAERLRELPSDLAVLRVAADSGICPAAATPPKALELRQALQRSVEGVLRTRTEDGRMVLTPVRLRDVGDEFLTVGWERVEDTIAQGMSGSLLEVEHRPAGLLQTVTAARKEARVIRLDRVQALAGPLGIRAVDESAPPPHGTRWWPIAASVAVVGGAGALLATRKDEDDTTPVVTAPTADLRLNNAKSGEFPCSGGLFFTMSVRNNSSSAELQVRSFILVMNSMSPLVCNTFRAPITVSDPPNLTIPAGQSATLRPAGVDLAGLLCSPPNGGRSCTWNATIEVDTTLGTASDSIQFTAR